MHPYLATYRIDVYNRFNRECSLEVLLYGSKNEKAGLGFDINRIYQLAEFQYTIKDTGWYIGRHLISTIYFKVINRFRPNVILAHELGVNTLVAIMLKFFLIHKVFLTVDDNPQMAKYEYGITRSILRRFVINYADGYVCVSPYTRQYLQDKYKKTNCKFIYFPIIQDDRRLFDNITASKSKADEYLEKYQLGEKKILLFVGRLEAVKSIDLLLAAYSEVKQEDTILILVGDGSKKGELQFLAEKLGIGFNTIFTGSLTGVDLYAWYYLAHIFILASNHEAFGAVVNEALVGGCRCIVSDHCGAYSLISDSNGAVFESGNQEALAGCMKKEIDGIDINKEHKSLMPKSFDEYFYELKTSMNI